MKGVSFKKEMVLEMTRLITSLGRLAGFIENIRTEEGQPGSKIFSKNVELTPTFLFCEV